MSPDTDRAARLARFFNPRSVAVVGASGSAAGFGGRTYANLAGFQGDVFPVNPKYASMGDRPCYASLRDLPRAPDCVVLAVPRAAVLDAVRQCVEIGAGGVVIFASGFGETGRREDAQQERELVRIAASSGLPILGPNCMGLIDTASGLNASFAIVPPQPPREHRAIAIVSQSGAMGMALMQASVRGIGFTHMVTAGNSVNIDVADVIDYLLGTPDCKAIACSFEGLREPLKLLRIGEKARAAGKVIVVHKLARSQAGADAALSHTGALAGSHAYYEALFERAGIVSVDSYEALLETAVFFARAMHVAAPGTAMMSGSGGAAIMAADCAAAHGVDMPPFGARATEVIRGFLPDFGALRNPCDLTAAVLNDPKAVPACAEAVLAQDDIGFLVVSQQMAGGAPGRTAAMAEVARRSGKVICVVWLSEWLQGPESREAEDGGRLPLFRSMGRCMAAIARLRAWREAEQRRAAAPRLAPAAADAQARSRLASISTAVATEREAKEVLRAYGVRTVSERLVQSAAEAVEAARAVGGPAVLKIESPDIPHKTEAGGVALNVSGDDAVRRAYDRILTSARAFAPQARINGVLVQPQLPAGVEMLVGGRVDPLFGPVLVVGLGGQFVELLRDTATALCPVNPAQARALLGRLKARAALDGFRGAAPVDIGALCAAICRISELLADQQDAIGEMEANPLICAGGDVLAVDALITLKGKTR